jgi:hypothetical protein
MAGKQDVKIEELSIDTKAAASSYQLNQYLLKGTYTREASIENP